ncbi:HNH endonuclease [Mycolicibacterium senegalense]|uniref:HNH endonuclease n=1 Tax=Mycolicibacterium senegalense TaxID=1796 RepID=UPI003AAF160B
MTEEARYSYSSEKNRLLLVALAEAWGMKCYWCKTPKLFRDLQIDHMIPRNPRGGTDLGFDVDAAANLAPICGPCNQEKNNGKFEEAPRFDAACTRAADLAPTVQRNLTRIYKDANVVKALLAVTAADLESEDVAESIAAFGAVIMPIFREKFPEVVDAEYTKDYTRRYPPVEVDGRRYQVPEERAFVQLDAEGQRALVILEDVLGLPMPAVLHEIRTYFDDDIENEVKQWLRRAESRQYRRADLDRRPRSNQIGVYIYEMRYANDQVTLTGELEGSFTASVEDNDRDLEDWTPSRHADFDFIGPFEATYSREGLIDAYIDIGEPEENRWRHTLRAMDLEE